MRASWPPTSTASSSPSRSTRSGRARTGPTSSTRDDAAFERARAAIRRASLRETTPPGSPRRRRGSRPPHAPRPDRQARARAGGAVRVRPSARGARLAGQLARRPAAARRRRPRGAAGRAGRAGRGDPPRAGLARARPSRTAAAASRRWSPIPAATSGSASRTTTSASRGASTTTRARGWDWSAC